MNRLILVLLALGVAMPVVIKSRQSGLDAAPAAFFNCTSARTVVRISGDVRHPGIYYLSANMLTIDAILMAVPAWRPNLFAPNGAEALPVCNGADIHVTRSPDDTAQIQIGMLPAAQRLQLSIPLDMNPMNEADFERIPGIGPVLAQRIIAYRHKNGGSFAPEDLLSIEGIGDKKYNQIIRYFK
jgi:competence protein ComEA